MATASVLWKLITDHATVLSAVVSAISTGFIAWFTVSLVGATNAQGRLTKMALNLAKAEFNASHRPLLVVRDVYWEDDARTVTFVLVNQGTTDAHIRECRLEFDRTDRRPILPSGENVSGVMLLKRGAFEIIHAPVGDTNGLVLAAFKMDVIPVVTFQGVFIYSDDEGITHRMVFKRVCKTGNTVFERTSNSDDEYSD